MIRSYKERVDHEVDKIKFGRTDQIKFLMTAIDIQNRAYDGMYADRRMEFACDVLSRTGFCSPIDCEHCKLTAANERAHKEIRDGKRFCIGIMKEADLSKPIVLTYFDDCGRVYSYRISNETFLNMRACESNSMFESRRKNTD